MPEKTTVKILKVTVQPVLVAIDEHGDVREMTVEPTVIAGPDFTQWATETLPEQVAQIEAKMNEKDGADA